jgi:hypothetical protein
MESAFLTGLSFGLSNLESALRLPRVLSLRRRPPPPHRSRRRRPRPRRDTRAKRRRRRRQGGDVLDWIALPQRCSTCKSLPSDGRFRLTDAARVPRARRLPRLRAIPNTRRRPNVPPVLDPQVRLPSYRARALSHGAREVLYCFRLSKERIRLAKKNSAPRQTATLEARRTATMPTTSSDADSHCCPHSRLSSCKIPIVGAPDPEQLAIRWSPSEL